MVRLEISTVFSKLSSNCERLESVVSENKTTFLSRNARFLWLGALFVPPASAYVAYQLTPHEEIWHEVLYSLLCIPIFLVWLVARSTEDLMDTVLRSAGVTGDEFALYSVLAASPGITPSETSGSPSVALSEA